MFVTESSEEVSENDSDLELQEAFAKGLVKPGLNIVSTEEKKKYTNNVIELKQKLTETELKLDWVERLDMVNAQAPLAPELAFKLKEEELKFQAKFSKNKGRGKGQKSKDVDSDNPVLNDFQRETLFHRQAQAAVLLGIPKLKDLGVKTKRPDDYFAEMAKSDQHMQKIREVLLRKQHSQERSERVRQQRQLRKVGKQVQIQAKLKQASEKRELLEEVKKYRKGLRTDLDFLDDKKKPQQSAKGNRKDTMKNRIKGKRRYKDQKFGFGGKKRGLKRNTKSSTSDVSEYRRPGKPKRPGMPQQKLQRPGKNRRMKMKAKKK